VNAAFLLMTSAWIAGSDPVPPAHPPAAPVVETHVPAAPHGSPSMHGGVETAASHEEGEGKHERKRPFKTYFDNLPGSRLFRKYEKDEKPEGCCVEHRAPVVTVPRPTTITYTPPVYYHTLPGCPDCDTPSKGGLFSKLRGKFSKGDTVEAGCSTCSSSGPAPVHPVPAATDSPHSPAPMGVSPSAPGQMAPTIAPKKMEPTIPSKDPARMPDKISASNPLPVITPASNKSPIQINRENPF
jgi:hypothetical protein